MAVSLNELPPAVSHRAGDEMHVTFVDTEGWCSQPRRKAPGAPRCSRSASKNTVEASCAFAWPVQVTHGTIEISVCSEVAGSERRRKRFDRCRRQGPPCRSR